MRAPTRAMGTQTKTGAAAHGGGPHPGGRGRPAFAGGSRPATIFRGCGGPQDGDMGTQGTARCMAARRSHGRQVHSKKVPVSLCPTRGVPVSPCPHHRDPCPCPLHPSFIPVFPPLVGSRGSGAARAHEGGQGVRGRPGRPGRPGGQAREGGLGGQAARAREGDQGRLDGQGAWAFKGGHGFTNLPALSLLLLPLPQGLITLLPDISDRMLTLKHDQLKLVCAARTQSARA